MKQILSSLQRVGGALMLPIAVLPIAGLLLRLGQPDLLNFPSMAAAGEAIFANLGLLFAIGVAVGLARENQGLWERYRRRAARDSFNRGGITPILRSVYRLSVHREKR